MKFGLFYEMSVPRPWTPEKERTVYNNCLEQVKLADELGFDHVWAVEHHFLEEYSHCSAPELFLTACAVLTKNIRVGHGIVVCVPEFNHPIKIAERTATLDILSGGRLRGRHRPLGHLDRARRLPRQPRHHQEELGRVRALPAEDVDAGDLLLRGRVLVDARAHHPAQAVPEAAPADVGGGDQPGHRDRRRRPRPRQPRPHLRGLRGAGEEDQRSTAGASSSASRSAPSSTSRSPRPTSCSATRTRRPASRWASGWATPSTTSPRSSSPPARSSPRRPTSRSACCRRCAAPPPAPTPTSSRPRAWPIGDPARIIRAVKKWEALGVDCINFILNANEVVPQEQVMASLRLFAKEVMPALRQEAGQAQRARRSRADAPLRNARHHQRRQGAADARQPRHRGLDAAQGRDAAAPDRGAAQLDRRAAAQGDASGAALLRDPGGHAILREPGRAVQSRHAAPGQPRRRPSARLPAGRGRQHRGGGQGAARPLGLAGRGRAR